MAWVTVRDHGRGIPEEARDKVFEPFFRESRARASRSGHGLGLPLARAVARAHDGDIQMMETGANGTTFRLEIPVDPG